MGYKAVHINDICISGQHVFEEKTVYQNYVNIRTNASMLLDKHASVCV